MSPTFTMHTLLRILKFARATNNIFMHLVWPGLPAKSRPAFVVQEENTKRQKNLFTPFFIRRLLNRNITTKIGFSKNFFGLSITFCTLLDRNVNHILPDYARTIHGLGKTLVLFVAPFVSDSSMAGLLIRVHQRKSTDKFRICTKIVQVSQECLLRTFRRKTRINRPAIDESLTKGATNRTSVFQVHV